MILIEKEIESALRSAIRASLIQYGSATPELVDARIVCFWLGDEENGPSEDASGLRVMLVAQPNSSAGWMPSMGFEPIRSVNVNVMCVSQPDSDKDRKVCLALYEAVRSVFEAPSGFTLPATINYGGTLITNGGAADIDDVGQVVSFTAELKIAL